MMSTQVKTYREATTFYLEGIKIRVCRELGIGKDAYDIMHYDLAFTWFETRGYFEYTARVFLMSKIFHKWWNQQVAHKEQQFIQEFGRQGLPVDLMRAALEEAIVSMKVVPSRELLRDMHNEGLFVLAQNPELWKIKIYRNG
jgi:hypothetical protein